MSGFGVDRGSGSSAGKPDSTLAESIIDAKGDLIAGTADNTAARVAVGANETRLVADSAQTPGVKWVADTVNYAIAAKGNILAGTAADTLAAVTVGANETRLVADSAQAAGVKYVADTVNYAIAAKGDLLAGTAADTAAAVTVGANGTVLTADSAQTPGVKWAESRGMPAGAMTDFAGTIAPTGWLECDGAVVSRSTYAALFSAIGVTWGAGNGSTTFALPDARRRTTVGSGGTAAGVLGNAVGNVGGAETHTLGTPEIPSHSHSMPSGGPGDTFTGGAGGNNLSATNTGGEGGGGAHNNMQPSMVVLRIIKT